MAKNRITKEKWKQWEERKMLILSADFRLADTGEAKEARIERARKDYQFFVETYFPHLCTDKETKEIIRCGKFQLDAAKYEGAPPYPRRL